MTDNVIIFLRRVADLYTGKRLTRAAAALSYSLTLSFFPLLIVIYSLLGSSAETAGRILRLAGGLMAEDTLKTVEDFLRYVRENNSRAMLMTGLSVLLTSASAAMRTMNTTIAEMQGRQCLQGLRRLVFSFIYSLAFLLTIYFAMLVMLTGPELLARLSKLLPRLDSGQLWQTLRFPLLLTIESLILCAVYRLPQEGGDHYRVLPGAIIASTAMTFDSMFFSAVIGRSAKYPLVYGSLSAPVLLMLWLYTCSLILLTGAAVNIVIRDMS